MARHGFHKPSAAWWAVEDGCFHRFLIVAEPKRTTGAMLILGVLGLGVLAIAGVKRAKRRQQRSEYRS